MFFVLTLHPKINQKGKEFFNIKVMKKNSNKGKGNRVSVMSRNIIFILLCFLYPYEISSQLFQNKATLFVSENTYLHTSKQDSNTDSESFEIIPEKIAVANLKNSADTKISDVKNIKPERKNAGLSSQKNHKTGKNHSHGEYAKSGVSSIKWNNLAVFTSSVSHRINENPVKINLENKSIAAEELHKTNVLLANPGISYELQPVSFYSQIIHASYGIRPPPAELI
jgi:hypothetical protein